MKSISVIPLSVFNLLDNSMSILTKKISARKLQTLTLWHITVMNAVGSRNKMVLVYLNIFKNRENTAEEQYSKS